MVFLGVCAWVPHTPAWGTGAFASLTALSVPPLLLPVMETCHVTLNCHGDALFLFLRGKGSLSGLAQTSGKTKSQRISS